MEEKVEDAVRVTSSWFSMSLDTDCLNGHQAMRQAGNIAIR